MQHWFKPQLPMSAETLAQDPSLQKLFQVGRWNSEGQFEFSALAFNVQDMAEIAQAAQSIRVDLDEFVKLAAYHYARQVLDQNRGAGA